MATEVAVDQTTAVIIELEIVKSVMMVTILMVMDVIIIVSLKIQFVAMVPKNQANNVMMVMQKIMMVAQTVARLM